MDDAQTGYVLAQASNEVERLQSWSRIWQPETEAMLDQIKVQPGWRTVDLACGPQGILGSLSRRVGPSGSVTACDIDPQMLSAARTYAENDGFTNIEFIASNSFQTNLPRASFDLVHARFMFAPLGRDDVLLQEMVSLTRPGGIVVSQESDESGYVCYPPHPAWERLKRLTVEAFARGGGDYSAGRRLYGLFRRSGLKDVQVRTACLALPAGHPYRYWPIESAVALRSRLLKWGLISGEELDRLLEACTRIANDPEIFLTSFNVIQTWGRKPLNG